MRKIAVLFSVALAFVVVYEGMPLSVPASEPTNHSVVSIDIWEAQVRAARDLPVTVVENPI
jgi:hypothetical protein